MYSKNLFIFIFSVAQNSTKDDLPGYRHPNRVNDELTYGAATS